MSNQSRTSLGEVSDYFSELEDPRTSINVQHPFVSVVMIALMGVLAGASGPTAIAKWAGLKKDLLLTSLELPNGIPCKDVFRRVLSTLNPGAFQACFTNWIQSLREVAVASSDSTDPLIMAIDGKTLRRSHDQSRGLGALHVVSVWATDLGLSLGQVATDEKSNEITAIPELLKLVDLKGTVITIDAMGTQKAIAAQVIEGGADYVLALKGNQPGLEQNVSAYINKQMEEGFTKRGVRRHTTKETSHGRDEIRNYIQMAQERRQEEEKVNELIQQIDCWDQAARIRDFINDVRITTVQRQGPIDDTGDVAKWMEWAINYADRIDPLGAERPNRD